MNFRNQLAKPVLLVLWLPIVFFSLLLAHNAILYFTHGGEYGILPEKLRARQDLVWNVAFYLHLPSGILCLLAPLFQFQKRILRTNFLVHKFIGDLYFWVTMLIVVPTGIYLALYAKGGLITQIGFIIQGLALGFFTYKARTSIMTGNISRHVEFVIRSYSIAAVVLSFRIFHILFFLLNVPYQENYALSQWLGLSVNAFLAELVIHFRRSMKPGSDRQYSSKSIPAPLNNNTL